MAIQGFDEVIAAAKLGAHWALEVLYRELAPSVIGWLRSQGHDDADDIASEVFVGMVRDIRQFEGDEARLRTWVFALAHHRLIDAQRYQTRRPITYVDPNDMQAQCSQPTTSNQALSMLLTPAFCTNCSIVSATINEG